MRAGLLSQPEVIQQINNRFISTTITYFDVCKLAKQGDELAQEIVPRWSNPVSLMFFSSEGAFISKLSPVQEFTEAHPDTDLRPGQTHCCNPEHNTQIFLNHLQEYFGKSP